MTQEPTPVQAAVADVGRAVTEFIAYFEGRKQCRGCGRRMLLWRWRWAHRRCAATMERWSMDGERR